MKTKFIRLFAASLSIAAVIYAVTQTQAGDGQPVSKSLVVLAYQATSPDPAKSKTAIDALRNSGAMGLEALSEVYSSQVAEHTLTPDNASGDQQWDRIRTAFDAVGQQRDCCVSKLFWFNDLEQAKAAARASEKPILSLRLLGKLNEEYSCANSRFFRTTLYANTTVANYLRDNFILHWQSVRPVPRITIDMGDGRRIERTITGNSIHYVLDADGNPIDALPGLYGAKTFVADLKEAATAERTAATLTGNEREVFLKHYQESRLAAIQAQWSRDVAQVGEQPVTGKSASEMPAAIIALHADDARLDATASRLLYSKESELERAMASTASKCIVETPMMRMVRNLERSIAEDTVRNEYQFHTRILEWMVSGSAPKTLDALNKKIYAELFLTPDSDPWLGLAPADTLSALEKGGLVTP